MTASFNGATLTTDWGTLLLRQADKRIDLLEHLAGCFTDCQWADRVEHPFGEMLAQRIYGLALGYKDFNDQEQLRLDSIMAVLVGKKRIGQQLAGKSALNRLELSPDGDAQKERYSKISYSAEAIDELLVMVFQESEARAPRRIVLDQDTTDAPFQAGRRCGSSKATTTTTATCRCTSSAAILCCGRGWGESHAAVNCPSIL